MCVAAEVDIVVISPLFLRTCTTLYQHSLHTLLLSLLLLQHLICTPPPPNVDAQHGRSG